jgi:hypothetical protein
MSPRPAEIKEPQEERGVDDDCAGGGAVGDDDVRHAGAGGGSRVLGRGGESRAGEEFYSGDESVQTRDRRREDGLVYAARAGDQRDRERAVLRRRSPKPLILVLRVFSVIVLACMVHEDPTPLQIACPPPLRTTPPLAQSFLKQPRAPYTQAIPLANHVRAMRVLARVQIAQEGEHFSRVAAGAEDDEQVRWGAGPAGAGARGARREDGEEAGGGEDEEGDAEEEEGLEEGG